MLHLCAEFTLTGVQIQTTFRLSNMVSMSRSIAIFIIANIQEMVGAKFMHIRNMSSYKILLRQTYIQKE
jgi:hypothetical protein